MSHLSDRWNTASSYEAYMGRWSRQLALVFLRWLGIRPGVHWLDVGCGTGALTQAICSQAEPASVTGCDPSASFLEFAREQNRDARAQFVVAGTGRLPSHPNGYGSVTSLLALNFFPDPARALEEMRSLAAPGGCVSACVWDYSGRMELLRYFWDAAVALDPAAQALDEGVRFKLCQPELLRETFVDAGLRDVRCQPIEIATAFADFDDYWQPMLQATGPAPSYVASLNDTSRATLRDHLEKVLPRGLRGSIPLVAGAWAIRGTRES